MGWPCCLSLLGHALLQGSVPAASVGSFGLAQAAANLPIKAAGAAPQPSYGTKRGLNAAIGSCAEVQLGLGNGLLPELASFQHFTTPPTQPLGLAGKQGECDTGSRHALSQYLVTLADQQWVSAGIQHQK